MAKRNFINKQNSSSKVKLNVSSFTLIVAFICLALFGLSLVRFLPVKLSPSANLPGFSVHFSMYGSSSRVVEMTATTKLESMLSRIKGITGINSTSYNGGASINVSLDKHAEVDAVRFEASTIIRQVWPQLPDNVNYPYLQMRVPDEKRAGPFMVFTINAPAIPIVIKQYVEENIKPKLARIPGVYRVDVNGGTPMEIRLEYDSEQLRQLEISVSDIQNAIQNHYRKEFLGMANMETSSGEKKWIRLALFPDNNQDYFKPSEIMVKSIDDKLINLDQLVRMSRVEEEPQSYYRINGLNSIYLSVTAEETANQLDVNAQIIEEMNAVKNVLPQGYEIHLSHDATQYISNELEKIYFRTTLTVLILLIFVFIITLSPKYLLLILISLTINISIAFIFYFLFGLEMQLYSLAGITISLNLIIDNTIVMTDHILHKRNLKAYLSILAATLTTMGALVIIFFLDEHIRLNLQDFAFVVIINLGVSLFVALFLVPALIDKLNLIENRKIRFRIKFGPKKYSRTIYKRLAVRFSHFYKMIIRFFLRWRIAVFILFILLFGLPVFLIPEKLEEENGKAELYNKTLGSTTYKENIKPIVDVALGGTLRLFMQKVNDGSYYPGNNEISLTVNANLPNGSTVEQMNNLISSMEIFLSQYKEIKQFHTDISSANRASIRIFFTEEHQKSGFPYILNSHIISKAIELGGGSWGVYGLENMGFNNDVRESAGSFRIRLFGYNYDELYELAEDLKTRLLVYHRIRDVIIGSEFSWWKDDYQEFFFDLNKRKLEEENISAMTLFNSIQPFFGKNINAGYIIGENGIERIKLNSRQSYEYDIFAMENFPYTINGRQYKLSELADIGKGQASQNVAKENRQYRLCIQYEYIGSSEQGKKIQERVVADFNEELPMGYKAEVEGYGFFWGGRDFKQVKRLLIIISIIFFISGILFNSLKQPLAIILVIPVSFIGVFLTFYWFKLNFDQGGFAAFVLLCGITVNASIYILNEFNSIRRNNPNIVPLHAYVKAWNSKIMPIFLTVLSTILGFIPFMIGMNKESFWFPLAAGTIGGLVMSIIGIFFLLPLFVLKRKS